jgi:hypothetical protein
VISIQLTAHVCKVKEGAVNVTGSSWLGLHEYQLRPARLLPADYLSGIGGTGIVSVVLILLALALAIVVEQRNFLCQMSVWREY